MFTYIDEELEEEDYEDEIISTYYVTFPVIFDKNCEMTTPAGNISDFNGVVDGMVYKTTFKQKYERWDEEEYTYVDDYMPWTIDFKVVNESKVIITGEIVDEYGNTIQFNETEAAISGDLPSWFTSNDWVYIPTEELEEAPLDFMILGVDSWMSGFSFGEIDMYSLTGNISSKNGAVAISALMKMETPIMTGSSSSIMEISKISDDKAKLNANITRSYVDVENKVEDGNFTSFTATLKRIDRNPEWLEGVNAIENEDWRVPVSSIAYNDYFGWATVTYDFDRVVDEDSVTITLLYGYEYDNDEDSRTCKEVYVIEKPVDGKFSCSLKLYEIDSAGNEIAIDSYEADDFKASAIIAVPM